MKKLFKNVCIITNVILLVFPMFQITASAQRCTKFEGSTSVPKHLVYQARGDHNGINRCEGIIPEPISESEIELISATANYKETIQGVPKNLKLRFFLQRPSEVDIIVQDLKDYHYRMDNIKPEKKWNIGFGNIFEWSGKGVIEHLNKINIYNDLAIIAYIKNLPSREIIPVVFYHSTHPSVIKGYKFKFKLGKYARLRCRIFREDGVNHVFKKIFPKGIGGSVFPISWDASREAEGKYRLVIEAYPLDGGQKFGQTVFFYHQPKIIK